MLVIGSGCGAIGYAGLIAAHNSLPGYMILAGVTSLALGFIEASTRTLVVDGLREGEVAIGEGMYELAITVGAAVGSAALGAIAAAHATRLPGLATQRGYELVWGVAAAVCLVALVTAALYAVAGRQAAKTRAAAHGTAASI